MGGLAGDRLLRRPGRRALVYRCGVDRMTRRPYLDERDPAEPREWVESSSPGIRRLALAQTAAAVKAAKDRKPATTEESA